MTRNGTPDWRWLGALFLIVVAAAGSGPAGAGAAERVPMATSDSETGDAYQFEFTGLDGDKLPLAAWRGRPVLVVNTASFCGYTPQYRDLEALWQRYRARGLVVLGVPANDFGEQEPGSAAPAPTRSIAGSPPSSAKPARRAGTFTNT